MKVAIFTAIIGVAAMVLFTIAACDWFGIIQVMKVAYFVALSMVIVAVLLVMAAFGTEMVRFFRK